MHKNKNRKIDWLIRKKLLILLVQEEKINK